ncbi:MAG: ACP S-malonyltransferase [Eubacteriales bacterium]|jgi:[acyl-carrier-protein] S-malonyltransferase
MTSAYLFAGQGAQKAGMGKDLYEHSEIFRKVFDDAALDFDLKRMCFEDPDGKLIETQYTQPCLTAMEVGITEILREAGLRPDYTAGLSLGEYSALEAAGVLTAEETIEMTAFRGKAMAEAAKGIECGMTAVLGLSEATLQTCCSEASDEGVVSICNYNCPGQLVIGGEKKAVDRAADYAVEAGARRCIPLQVSGPFHTAFMAPAGKKLEAYFADTVFRPAQSIVMYNCLGGENTTGAPVGDLLVKQVQSSVYMEQILRNMFAAGVTEFVEIGPGKTLSGFVRKTAKAVGTDNYRTWNLDSFESVTEYIESLKEALKGA